MPRGIYKDPTLKRGFQLLDPDKHREIAAKGGKTAHLEGVAHQWNSQTAREAAAKSQAVRRAKKQVA